MPFAMRGFLSVDTNSTPVSAIGTVVSVTALITPRSSGRQSDGLKLLVLTFLFTFLLCGRHQEFP